jgi:hypothetical protein
MTVDTAKVDYEEQLGSVNKLRGDMMDMLSRYQSAVFLLVKKRAHYVRLAKKAGIDVPKPTWWEKGIGQ